MITPHELKQKINTLVDQICLEFSDNDREIIKIEIYKKIHNIDFIGRSWNDIIVSSIYLMSKCPANADYPLSITTISSRYSSVNNWANWKRSVSFLRETGVFPPVCLITVEQILISRIDELRDIIVKKNQSDMDRNKIDEFIDKIVDKAIEISRKKSFRLLMIGRSPYTVTAGLLNTLLTHTSREDIAKVFGCTTTSVANSYRRIIHSFGGEVK